MISNTMIQTRNYDHPLFYYEATMRTKALDLLTQLKRFIHARVIKSPQLQQTRFKGQQMIIQLFAYFHRDPQHLLPSSIGREFNAAAGDSAKTRVICEYPASMPAASLMAPTEPPMHPT